MVVECLDSRIDGIDNLMILIFNRNLEIKTIIMS